MTKAVFFDVGNTLVRACPSVAETFARVAAERGPCAHRARRGAAHARPGRLLRGRIPARRRLLVLARGVGGHLAGTVPLPVPPHRHRARRRRHGAGRARDVPPRRRLGGVPRRRGLPEDAQAAGTHARRGVQLGRGARGAAARAAPAAVLRRGGVLGGRGAPQARPGRLRPRLRGRWASRSATRCMWATAPMRTAKGRRGPASGPSSSIGATWRTAVPTSASSR